MRCVLLILSCRRHSFILIHSFIRTDSSRTQRLTHLTLKPAQPCSGRVFYIPDFVFCIGLLLYFSIMDKPVKIYFCQPGPFPVSEWEQADMYARMDSNVVVLVWCSLNFVSIRSLQRHEHKRQYVSILTRPSL